MAFDTELIGSAGTFTAAGLVTAGQYLQSSILDTFAAGLGSQLGALLYVIAGISGIFLVAIGGNYKWGLWFFIGPALFYQATMVRVPSLGTEWRTGERIGDPARVELVTTGVVDRTDPSEVALFFAMWEKFSSGVVQTFIQALDLTDIDADLQFISQTQRFGSLFHMQISDPEVRRFMQLVTVQECSEYFALQLGIVTRERKEFEDITAQIAVTGEVVRINKASSSYALIEQLHRDKYFGDPGPALRDSYNCRNIWELAFLALQHESETIIDRVTSSSRDPHLTPEVIKRELSKKFDHYENPLGEDYAVSMMVRAIASRLLYDHIAEVLPGVIQRNLARFYSDPKRADANTPESPFHSVLDNLAEDLRYSPGASYESHWKGEYLSAVLAMPYVQGIALYFLAMAYPFFAMALIIPGRYPTFFTWMGCWFWVKSWDFGFAVVMLLDKLLYRLLPQGPEITDQILQDPNAPSLVFKEVLRADPTYTINLYYNLLAMAIAAVPIITGILVKRGSSEFQDALMQGFHGFAGNLGAAMASYSRSYTAQALAGGAERAKVRAADAAVFSALTDREVLTGLGLKMWANMGMQVQGNKMFARNSSTGRLEQLSGGQMKSLFADVSAAMNKPVSDYGFQLAQAKFNAIISMAEWKATMSPEVMRKAELAVLMKYYNHDFISGGGPYDALETLAIARQNFQMGGSLSTLVGSLLSGGTAKLGHAAVTSAVRSSPKQMAGAAAAYVTGSSNGGVGVAAHTIPRVAGDNTPGDDLSIGRGGARKE